MKQLAFVLVSVLAITGARADAPVHSVTQSGQEQELDCGDGGKVIVKGSDNTLTIMGSCTELSINGSTNDIEIDSVDKITIVAGNGNTVQWSKGYKAKAPKVKKKGKNNKIIQSKD